MKEAEIQRLGEMYAIEESLKAKGFCTIAGVDEAGRGPLAGDVYAAAVVLPEGILIEGLNDSKKISEKKREKLYDEITEKAVAWGVGIVDNNVIDEINILNATRRAMHMALLDLEEKPDYVLVDAEKNVDTNGIPFMPIIKGDALSISIASASIIAKVTRDRMMKQYDEMFPMYGFEKHKGYGTKAHIEAIKKNGLCMIHRKTFSEKQKLWLSFSASYIKIGKDIQ